MSLRQRWNSFWFAAEAPVNLGICRAIFYAVMLYHFIRYPFHRFGEMGPRSAFWDPIWFFKTLHVPVIHGGGLMAAEIIFKIALVLACVGLFTSLSTALSAILGLYLIAMSMNYGKIEHQTLPIAWTLIILAMARCGDAFSIDALLRRARGLPRQAPSGEYRWPVRMVWVLMSITFLAAGIAKLRYTGIDWALGPQFSVLMRKPHYGLNPPHVAWGLYIANWPIISRMMASGSLFVELFFVLALFDRRARFFFPLAAFGMQLGIGLMMNVWFTLFAGIYIFWVPWGRLLGRVLRLNRSRSR